MLLIYSDPKAWEALSAQESENVLKEYMTFTIGIVESNEYKSGAPLQGIDTATTVRVHDGERLVTDGPFAETREVLGGYYIVDVPDLDRALEIAAEIPGNKRGISSVEVRPVQEVPDMNV
ncbi:MAG: hypothetical protein QOI55_1667 [Actinomycetota bacterium]|nr:hypothetical protein [Actinomycetota bacterium]